MVTIIDFWKSISYLFEEFWDWCWKLQLINPKSITGTHLENIRAIMDICKVYMLFQDLQGQHLELYLIASKYNTQILWNNISHFWFKNLQISFIWRYFKLILKKRKYHFYKLLATWGWRPLIGPKEPTSLQNLEGRMVPLTSITQNNVTLLVSLEMKSILLTSSK